MRTTTDYMIGNTAIQIIHTRKKIKIVDVEKEERKRFFWKLVLFTLISSSFVLGSCLYIVDQHNTLTMMSRQNYRLENEIEELEKENLILARKLETIEIDYDTLYKQAKEMGMKFPSSNQVYEYDVEKSTAVRVSSEPD